MTIPRIDGLDRNYYNNGNFEYWQRAGSTSLAITNSFAFWADRWELGKGGTWVVNGQRSTDVPSTKSKYSLEVSGTVGDLVNDDMVYRQKMESIFARDLANKIVSISMKVKTNNMKQVKLRLAIPTVEDVFSGLGASFVDDTVNIVDDSTWQEVTFENIAVPADAIKGLDTKIDVTNATGLVASDIKISEIKISIGTKAQSFSLAGRDLAEELQLCQRYFEKSHNIDNVPGVTLLDSDLIEFYNNTSQAGSMRGVVSYKVRKRSIPVITVYDEVGNLNKVTIDGTTHNIARFGPSKSNEYSFVEGAISGASKNITSFTYISDAEL